MNTNQIDDAALTVVLHVFRLYNPNLFQQNINLKQAILHLLTIKKINQQNKVKINTRK